MNDVEHGVTKEISKERGYRTALVIPVFNEEGRIGLQLAKIAKSHEYDVVIIDGGSDDRTLAEVNENLTVVTAIIRVSNSQGLSHQLRIGFNYCINSGYTNVITMDGNNKDEPREIERIKEKLEDGNVVESNLKNQ